MNKIFKFIKNYQDYRLRKFCIKQVCKSSIIQTHASEVDPETGIAYQDPLAKEAEMLYKFTKGE